MLFHNTVSPFLLWNRVTLAFKVRKLFSTPIVIDGIQPEGGSGKTTLALHLAVASSNAGQNTAILDLDQQASVANWADRGAA